jgi:hypothetical protein
MIAVAKQKSRLGLATTRGDPWITLASDNRRVLALQSAYIG